MTNQEYAAGLRELAAWVEVTDLEMDSRLTVNVWTFDEDTFADMGRRLGGKRDKVLEGSFAIVRRTFGPHRVDVNLNREQFCKKVQVGERVVPATEEHVEPIYEWECEGFEVIKP